MATLTAAQTLSAGRLIARRIAPYFRALLHSFEAREMPGLGTVAATKRGILLYDPLFVAGLAPEEMAGVWLHECMHRLNKHFDRLGSRDPQAFNIAGDLAINPAVLDMGARLPTGDKAGVFPEAFGFPRGLTAEEYYERLRKESKSGGKSGGEGEGKPHAAGGWCGSCAGRPVPGEPEDKGGGQGDGRTDAELERLTRQVAEEIRDRAKRGRGTLPDTLARWAEGYLQPPRIPWRQKLARIVRSAVAWRAGAVDHRYDGPARRQAGLGYGADRPVLARLRMPVPRVAVAVDTSGSMGQAEMTAALRETRGVLSAVGAEVDFVSCDAQVHGLGKIRRVEDVAGLLKGGGGTDFRPVFAALDKRRPRPEVLVFVTDGQGPAPEVAPAGMKVVWVLVGPYKATPATFGEVIEIDEDEKT